MNNTKFFSAAQLFVVFLLSGCNLTAGLLNYENESTPSVMPETVVSDNAQSENNQFSLTDFPSESCSDPLPEDPQVYPIEVYSVFLYSADFQELDKSRRNAETIKSDFCPNSSVWIDHEQNEIAQFTSLDRATSFKEIIEAELSNNTLRISSPQIIEVSPSQITILSTKEEIGRAAGLTELQIEELIYLEEYKSSFDMFSIEEEHRIRNVKAVVPTYLPSGFRIDEFNINEFGDYFISYKNDYDGCFSIYDTGLRGDAPARHETVRAVYSHALGYVDLGYTETDRLGGWEFTTGFDLVRIGADGQVNDWDSEGGYILGFSSGGVCTQQLSLQELIKVIQSLHFLNPLQN